MSNRDVQTKSHGLSFSSFLREKHRDRRDSAKPVQAFEELLRDEEFWNGLHQGPRLDTDPVDSSTEAFDSDDVAELARLGILKMAPWLSQESALSMCRAIERLQRLGFPPSAFILSDGFWHELRSPLLHAHLHKLFPAGWSISSRINVTVVRSDDVALSKGWRPHIDADRAHRCSTNGIPERLSLWTALTEASADTSCIHIISRTAKTESHRALLRREQMPTATAMTLLHESRALPCPQGASILWAPDLLHWGGRMHDQYAGPRVSWLMEIVSADAKRRTGEAPFIPLRERIPTYAERLHLWATHIQKVHAFEEFDDELIPFVALAQRVTAMG